MTAHISAEASEMNKDGGSLVHGLIISPLEGLGAAADGVVHQPLAIDASVHRDVEREAA